MTWDALRAEYFSKSVSDALDDELRELGFSRVDSEDGQSVRYQKRDVLFELTYHVDTAPTYQVMSGIGLKDSDERVRLLPTWVLFDSDESQPDWSFTSPEELRDSLLEMKRRLLERLTPLWNDTGRLNQLISTHEAQLRRTHQEAVDAELVGRARRAFASRDYGQALESYALVGPETLSEVDRRRWEYARKQDR